MFHDSSESIWVTQLRIHLSENSRWIVQQAYDHNTAITSEEAEKFLLKLTRNVIVIERYVHLKTSSSKMMTILTHSVEKLQVLLEYSACC